jgi:hypothetical protein
MQVESQAANSFSSEYAHLQICNLYTTMQPPLDYNECMVGIPSISRPGLFGSD